MSASSTKGVHFAVWAALWVGAFAALGAGAFAQAACETRYAEAETAYLEARFDAAIAPLEDCLRGDTLGNEERIRFNRLLAFAYLGRDGRASPDGRTAVERLLALDPSFRADEARDRPDFVALVDEVRSAPSGVPERKPEPAARSGDRSPWLIAAVGVAAAVIAVVLLGGDVFDG